MEEYQKMINEVMADYRHMQEVLAKFQKEAVAKAIKQKLKQHQKREV